MQRARIFEIAGAFLLGGGLVAVGYEVVLDDRADADPDETAEVGSEDTDRPPGADGDEPAYASADSVEPPVDNGGAGADPSSLHLQAGEDGSYLGYPEIFAPVVPLTPQDEQDYPQHGLVTTLAAIVRVRADLESPILGILRGGTRVRVDAERTFGGGCKQGWNKVFPRGWVCRKAGLSVSEEPPQDGIALPDPQLDSPLPYEYWRVKDEMTPFFHRLPSFEEQNRADAAGTAWYGEHQREPMPTRQSDRPDDVPAVVKEYMNAGYYVTKAGEEIKSQRRFLRTMRGQYARKYQLRPKESPNFRGLVVTAENELPIYFIRREIALQQRESETSDVFVSTDDIPERLSTYPFRRTLHIGPKDYYEDAEGRVMRSYAVSKAYKLKRPPGVGAEENWVHIDLSEQTLVAHAGDRPVFVTLVSTGKEPGMTPIGVHRIQIKHIATSMRDQPEEDEAYSIDDVPWTQYFSGSIAIHGAFWHAGYGLVRSHGCVNISPSDARWLFGFTDPALPHGWHAAAPTGRKDKGSPVVVTQ